MKDVNERRKHRVPDFELERRQEAILAAMKKESIDAIFFGGQNNWVCGMTKYIADLRVTSYPHYYLFSDKGFSIFAHAAWGAPAIPVYANPKGKYGTLDSIGVPSLPTTYYGYDWYPIEMAKVIKKHGYKKIGYCSTYCIPLPIGKYLEENLPDVEFVDFTDQVDTIKAVKSEWELEQAWKCVALLDDLMACMPSIIRVGLTEREVSRHIRSLADEMGCYEHHILIGSHPSNPFITYYEYQNFTFEPNDYAMVLIEVPEPGGVWGEVGRIFKLGDPPSERMMTALQTQIEIADKTAAMMKPGVKVSDIFAQMNQMFLDGGYSEERRIVTHGQGYDIVERPVFVKEETMVLQENMFIAHHPRPIKPGAEGVVGYCCDNYLITKDGAKIMSKTPRTIINVNR